MKRQTTITVQAYEWHDNQNGNSYFFAFLMIDGITDSLLLECQYGYGDHYLYESKEVMIKAGLIPKNYRSPLWVWCNENGVKLQNSKSLITSKEFKRQDKIFDALKAKHPDGIDGINADRAKNTE